MESLPDMNQCSKSFFKNDCGCRILSEYMVKRTNPEYCYDHVLKKISLIGSNYFKYWLHNPYDIPA